MTGDDAKTSHEGDLDATISHRLGDTSVLQVVPLELVSAGCTPPLERTGKTGIRYQNSDSLLVGWRGGKGRE
jgi:hypothetical protein